MVTPSAATPPPLYGFDAATSAREARDEASFLRVPSAEGALATARTIGARAHFAGSPGDYALATYMRDRLSAFGFDATLETTRTRIEGVDELALAIERAGSPPEPLELHETPDAADPDATRPDAGLPYNYGSADGDVRAPLVYAGHGLERDYGTLAAARVDVRGAIVLLRYGAQYRGLLAERAAQRGAAGVIFYSDPKDDPTRPGGAVQRGMVSRRGLTIPTLPVTAAAARSLLGTIRGAPAPAAWAGALRAPYTLGRSDATVHLLVRLRRSAGTLWNTVGVLRGSGPGTVILGGHRDAWVYGVTDNGAGITTLIEVARGLGTLARGGWRPRRTIVIAGWDGEEIGEAGSRAFARAHAGELRSTCVAYINADENVTGARFDADAAAGLADLVASATRDVPAPGGAASIFATWRNRTVDAPGGGSDHEVFLFDLGIPIVEVGFGGRLGVYHSGFDDLRWATTVGDPGFSRHRSIAQLMGVLAMRLADAPVVPYRFVAYASSMKRAAAALRPRIDTSELEAAVVRFGAAAARFDGAAMRGSAARNPGALAASRLLDVTLYGAVGYETLPFPRIAAALASHDAQKARAELRATVRTIDRARSRLAFPALAWAAGRRAK